MSDKEFKNRVELIYKGGGFIPQNESAVELCDRCVEGEIVSFKEITARDLNFHKCYMSLLKFIYGYLPDKFKSAVPSDAFYMWLKHLQGKYKILFEFQDGTKLVEYESIAFGNMSQKRFRDYVAEQLPFVYENVIAKFYQGKTYDNIIQTIEEQYERFLVKL